MFVIIGAQRTGTNLLREVLNTNGAVAMLGEIFSPSAAPAHWDNYLRDHAIEVTAVATEAELSALLDRYFDYVDHRVRGYWEGNRKRDASAIGVDIKYNQLGSLAPRNRAAGSSPFLLEYLRSRGAVIVHAVRENIIECALSALIGAQRNVWHDYGDAEIDRQYVVDPASCIAYARSIVLDRAAFLAWAGDAPLVTARYEDVARAVASTRPGDEVPIDPGPLADIARALGVPCTFSYDGRLRKALRLPFKVLIANYDELVRALRASEFAGFSPA
jgi:LPS sulfotransferase NodH